MQTEPVGRRYATAFALIVFFLFGFLFFYFYQRYEQDAYLPNRDATATADGLTLKASADGHFRTTGTINGEPVVFMLDTGATGVALSESLARRLGVTGRGSGQVSTANGVTQAQLAQLDVLAFGGWTFEDVPAFIMPQMDDEVLLGMQVLRHFRWHQEAGVLRLQPPE